MLKSCGESCGVVRIMNGKIVLLSLSQEVPREGVKHQKAAVLRTTYGVRGYLLCFTGNHCLAGAGAVLRSWVGRPMRVFRWRKHSRITTWPDQEMNQTVLPTRSLWLFIHRENLVCGEIEKLGTDRTYELSPQG